MLALIFGIFSYVNTNQKVYADSQSVLEGPNQSIGIGKGVYPGRVVWVHNPNALNQSCTNTYGDYWSQDNNTHQTVVNNMVSEAIQMLTGKGSDVEAWDAIFRYYNQTHARGDIGYTAGEKIVIKINLNTGVSGSNNVRVNFQTVDTSPQILYAVLDQLINRAGVAQADISAGDPGRNIDNLYWDKCHPIFPNVKYFGNGTGRTPIVRSTLPELMTSDGQMQNYLPAAYVDAAYLINIPVFKQHHRAGISLSSKNHFGTLLPYLSGGSAFPAHYSLPCTQGNGNVDNGGYGKYRIFVDFIGHKDLGGKTILYLFDALWSSTNYGDPPWRWRTSPFNTNYPASVFASQDPVAIESVGFDFLHNEFYAGNPSGNAFPQYSGVDDFLHQAADSLNWPATIKYDPEGDGTYLPRSMGVHEHWNNAADKKYTRNLGTGEGIDLIEVEHPSDINTGDNANHLNEYFQLYTNYPNPFNPGTTIVYTLPKQSSVEVTIYDLEGHAARTYTFNAQSAGYQKVVWDGINDLGRPASSGVYMYRVRATSLEDGKIFDKSKKMVLLK